MLPRTVLYIEDTRSNVELLERLIARRSDLNLLTAINGRLGILLAKEFLPDVIITDINLPDINGFEVLKILDGNPATKHIPIIALSSDAYTRQVDNGIKAGFTLYLTKPFKITELMDAIDAALHRPRSSAPTVGGVASS